MIGSRPLLFSWGCSSPVDIEIYDRLNNNRTINMNCVRDITRCDYNDDMTKWPIISFEFFGGGACDWIYLSVEDRDRDFNFINSHFTINARQHDPSSS